MRKHDTLMALALGALFLLSGCQNDEDFDLEGYPVNHPSVTIEDAEGAESVELEATYQADGKLSLSGPVSRTYHFSFLPSPEDAKVKFETLLKNIPGEYVEIEPTEVVIPAGTADALVKVTLKNEDFSFAQSNDNEETYEVGVKAFVEGFNMAERELESKVIIKKEAYSVTCTAEGPDDNTAVFERAYVKGQGVVNPEPISYKFKVVLDRVARKDVKVMLSTTGLAEQFFDNVTVAPETLVIPAGERELEITWTLTDDFLCQTDESESYTLKVGVVVESEDEVVRVDEVRSVLTFHIEKVVRNLTCVESKDETWKELDNKDDWSAETNGNGSASRLIDGRGGYSPSCVYKHEELSFTIDMATEKTINAMAIDYTGRLEIDYWTFEYYFKTKNSPKMVTVSTSLDGTTWVKQGALDTPHELSHYFSFFAPVKARYVKVEMNGQHESGYSNDIEVTEVYLYGKE